MYYFRFVFSLKTFCFRSVGPLPTCFSMRGNLKALRSDASLGSQLQLFKASHKLSIFELRTSCIFSSNKGCGIRVILMWKSLKFCMVPNYAHWLTDFRTVFVFALGPFLPMKVIFFDFNGNFNGKME